MRTLPQRLIGGFAPRNPAPKQWEGFGSGPIPMGSGPTPAMEGSRILRGGLPIVWEMEKHTGKKTMELCLFVCLFFQHTFISLMWWHVGFVQTCSNPIQTHMCVLFGRTSSPSTRRSVWFSPRRPAWLPEAVPQWLQWSTSPERQEFVCEQCGCLISCARQLLEAATRDVSSWHSYYHFPPPSNGTCQHVQVKRNAKECD